jgi:Flp pilus assembly protein TadG
MLRRHSPRHRRGATLVEAALVYPTVFMLILGAIVAGLGVSRAQQMALLAREGARYASVRGAQFATDTGNAAATSTAIQTYVRGKAAGMNTGSLTVTTTWNTSNSLTHTSGSPPSTIKNTVSVTVSYPWVPEAYFGGVTLSSTSVMTMAY